MKFYTFCVAATLPFALAGQESSENKLNMSTSPIFDVVITEIMADPDPVVGLPDAEYVEILNRSAGPVDLTGWILFDGSSRLLPGYLLLPGEYLIICANSDTTDFVPFGNICGISSLSLTNGGELLALRNAFGLTIDSISYDDDWHNSAFKKDGGWSLERIDTEFTCLIAANWTSSLATSGGTPGVENSVKGIFTDNINPVLLRALCPDSSSILVVFSEAMNPSQATDSQNYILTNASEILNAEMADASNTSVLLHLSQNLTGNVGLLAVNGISDCAGNMTDNTGFIKFGIADTGTVSKLAINEILFNPYEEGYDFVELYNYGNSIIDISRIKFASLNISTGDIDGMEIISEVPWMIFPGDYLVLSENPFQVSTQYPSSYPFNFITVAEMPTMNIDAGRVAILMDGIKIDEVNYSEDFHYPLLENPKGVSLEKINPLRSSMDPGSWHSASASSGFATPGLKNSQFAETMSEAKPVSVWPEIFSPDQDGYDDLITFTVQPGKYGFISNIRIYNADGHVIFENSKNTLVGTLGTFTWDGISNEGTAASPGIYVALVELFNIEGVVEKYKLAFVLATKL